MTIIIEGLKIENATKIINFVKYGKIKRIIPERQNDDSYLFTLYIEDVGISTDGKVITLVDNLTQLVIPPSMYDMIRIKRG